MPLPPVIITYVAALPVAMQSLPLLARLAGEAPGMDLLPVRMPALG